jgi:hypothetical protein
VDEGTVELLGEGLSVDRVDVGDEDLRTLPVQPAGDRGPDPVGSAGDQSDLGHDPSF